MEIVIGILIVIMGYYLIYAVLAYKIHRTHKKLKDWNSFEDVDPPFDVRLELMHPNGIAHGVNDVCGISIYENGELKNTLIEFSYWRKLPTKIDFKK